MIRISKYACAMRTICACYLCRSGNSGTSFIIRIINCMSSSKNIIYSFILDAKYSKKKIIIEIKISLIKILHQKINVNYEL